MRLLALAAAVAALAGCGAAASGDATAALTWAGKPLTYTPPELPQDRLVTGTLRNVSGRALELDVHAARLVDADGRTIDGTIRFAGSFGHGLYSPRRAPAEPDPDFERRRLGELADVAVGATVPVTVSWRGRAPVALRVGATTLELP
jgi:hypothetical protein